MRFAGRRWGAGVCFAILSFASLQAWAQSQCLPGYECAPLIYTQWCYSLGQVPTCHGVPGTICEELSVGNPPYIGVRSWLDELSWEIDFRTCLNPIVIGGSGVLGPITANGSGGL
jgi:hypothetical protein